MSNSAVPLCPGCNLRPINRGYKHCSKACAQAAQSTPDPVICPTCNINPVNPGYKHCSKTCAKNTGSPPTDVPSAFADLCANCETQPANPPHRYCSRACGREDREQKALWDALGDPDYPEVDDLDPSSEDDSSEDDSPENNQLAFRAMAIRQPPPRKRAPGLIAVPRNDRIFGRISNRFAKQWKHPTPLPKIARLYRIVMRKRLDDTYLARRRAIEKRGRFKARGMLEGNERLRWHGTQRNCNVGDPGSGSTMCNSPTCYVCIVMRDSFDLNKTKPGSMFGRGVYTTGTSSKAAGYVKQGPDVRSKHRAILLARVVVGRPYIMRSADQSLRRPPAGYDSVRGVPGTALKYDEVIVYNNAQVRPQFLLIFDR